ncbi:hypothetical protein [Pseudoalteromonas phage B8b]|uniref:Uncharacterized protein n=1 Tax=Pseudoalteromonas phage B8b TaxID=1506997 RepID=A0A076GEC8_9CAUD|nr:hypothetical protein [Pseudoalteromonas phage B8b]|tara:strand:- start:2770 stop:3390 length:621 start_codon:yes stop_codon:yes gene_type:complete
MSDFEPVVPYLADFSPVEPLDGFLIDPVTPSPEQFVARLDGATKHWQLSESIPLTSGDIVRLSVNVSALIGSFQYVIDDASGSFNRLFFILNDNGSISFRDAIINSLKIDGFQYASGSTPPIYDGEFHEIEIAIKSNSNLSVLGSRFNFIEFFGGSIKDLEVFKGGVLTNQIPLTNKSQGATQLATVGNVNATMINYTGDEWEQLP